jgi:competence protein ComEA
MRTVITPSRRRTSDSLVRRRADALFAPGHPQPSHPHPVTPSPSPSPPRPPDPPPPVAAAVPPPPGRRRAPLLARLPLALQERLDLDRRAVIGLSVLLALALGYGVQHFWAGRPEAVAVPVADGSAGPGAATLDSGPLVTPPSAPPPSLPPLSVPPLSAPDPSAGPAPGPVAGPSRPSGLVVDVAGKVRAPGLRTLPPGARVQDALQAAGGPLPGTDLTGLNLARPLGDGEEVVVGAPGPPASGSGSGPPTAPLSLSSATAQQLDALPGVGPVLAQRIVQYREQHGGFQSVDQLRHVSGFGERRLQDLRAVLRP